MPETKEIVYLQLGERIKFYRKLSGFTQEMLGNAIGVTRTSMVHIEGGKQRISLVSLLNVSEVLSVPVVALLGIGADGSDYNDKMNKVYVSAYKRGYLTCLGHLADISSGLVDKIEEEFPV